MGQLSESTPTSPYTFPPAWNLFGEVDRSKFKWEPPTATTSTDNTAGVLNWLQGLIIPAPAPAIPKPIPTMPAPAISVSEEFTNADIDTLQEAMRLASEDDFPKLCEQFSKRLKQSLLLGEVSSSTVIAALGCYRNVIPASKLRKSLLLALCRDIWDGITACKVVPLSDIDGLVMGKLVDVLSNLPMSFEVRTFAHSIVCSASTAQLNKMRQSIIKMVDAWAQTWLVNDYQSTIDMSIIEIERAVDSVQLMLNRSDRLIAEWKQPRKLTKAQPRSGLWTLQHHPNHTSLLRKHLREPTKPQSRNGFRTLRLQRTRFITWEHTWRPTNIQRRGGIRTLQLRRDRTSLLAWKHPRQPSEFERKCGTWTLQLQRDRTSLVSDLLHLARSAREGIYQNIKAIDLAENNVSSHQSSVSILAETLSHIDKHSGLMSAIITICSAHLKKASDESLLKSRSILRYHWLSLVAQIPKVADGLFVRTLQLFEDQGKRNLRQKSIVPIILERWIAQGVVKQPLIVKNEFKAKSRSREHFSDLITTLKKCKEPWWTRTEETFGLLQQLGKYSLVYNILRAMFERGTIPHSPIIERAINDLSAVDVRKAYRIYQIWLPLRPDREPIRFWRCPNFVLLMIKSKQFSSGEIWKTLNIPMWDRESAYQGFRADGVFPGFSKDPNDRLSQAMVNLITKMAVAFSESRSSKTGLLEVSRCLLYLRIRGNPIPPEITRALTYSGITMPMIQGCWLNQFKVGWLLKMIEQTEGTPAAERLDELVYLYREHLLRKEAECRKKAQPPKFGWGRSIE